MFNLNNIIKQKYIFFVFFLFVVLLGIGYWATVNTLDPDFGWHLRTGQMILEKGVPKVDWYSYTMPSFPWIDHEWLTEVLVYGIYSSYGYSFLLLFFLSVFTLAFILLIKKDRFIYYLVPIFLGYLASLAFLGARPQLLSIFFIAVLAFVIDRFSDNPSTLLIYTCPILFLLWVNLHGGFIIGLLLIFLFLVLEIFKKTRLFRQIVSCKFFKGQNYKEASDRKIKILLALFAACALATLINPYGLGLYNSVDFKSMGDYFLKSHVAEWEPLFSVYAYPSSIFIILYLASFLSFMLVFYKKIECNKVALSLLFLLFAVSSQRNFLVFVILTIPVFAELIFQCGATVNVSQIGYTFNKMKGLLAILVIAGLLVMAYLHFTNKSQADAAGYYPVKAVAFLKTLPLSENLLNEYGWGGYLIWNFPERKVFIDGRMPAWRENGQFAFGDYVKIMEGQSGAQELLSRYNIKLALLGKNEKDLAEEYDRGQKENNQLVKFLEKQKWACSLFGIFVPSKNIYNVLMGSGWREIYSDESALILEKQ